ncbi:hypothetical protein, conserved [Babesia bigemina]|uniref:Uncharacterized protein n=1 Tax=Babesia bigemina TaxID=5866 RepID=A0A061D669_BABBI|nr:hypothetical protein, conserved [Babesia bigemina]CDR95512.1 hypothetical protein, conserved [Babesia bigemina]|eukprot:XP_012767698.1 hypothetical protein, conserved [Babesia bigemina]
MNFVRTHNYSSDKASGGHIDFTKGSLFSTDGAAPSTKGRQRERADKPDVDFKPKELFCDRDLEFTAENLTSATAIASAFSEEDIAHLDQLERRRNLLWKRRSLEEEEFIKEAQRLRSAQPDEETQESKKPKKDAEQGKERRHRISLFRTTRADTLTFEKGSYPAIQIAVVGTAPSNYTNEGKSVDNEDKEGHKSSSVSNLGITERSHASVSAKGGLVVPQKKSSSALALVSGYSSEEDV